MISISDISFSQGLAVSVLCTPLLAAGIANLIKEKFSWLTPLISSFLLLLTALGTAVLLADAGIPDQKFSIPWFTLNNKIVSIGFLLDPTTLTMVTVVTWVSFFVHIFSIGYMAQDKNVIRYFSLLGFFTFAMLGLVMSNNLLVTFCFWELVGFSSYRLIGHWHEKQAAAQASTKAYLLNKVGDLGFLIGLMILWSKAGNLDIDAFTAIDPTWLTTAGICIFFGVVGKSAQFPLLNWLPDAMEGPTPVSALIHAATMVAAGVFLLIRIEPIFTANSLLIVASVGAITAVWGALGALVQFDIKKILAYSTISQLGLMVMAIGSGAMQGAYEHLLHHAFFKAGLFLGTGSILHAMHQVIKHEQPAFDVQDIRSLGGLRKKLPVTYLGFLICAASLAGLPLTAGFISKEMILTDVQTWAGSIFSIRWLVLLSAWIVTFLTPLYTFRLVWYVFFGKENLTPVREVPMIMRVPVLALAFGSISFLFYQGQLNSLTNWLMGTTHHTPFSITVISVSLIILSLIIGYLLYRSRSVKAVAPWLAPHHLLDWIDLQIINLSHLFSRITSFVDKNLIDLFIHQLIYVQVTMAFITNWTDRYILDGLVNGSASAARGVGIFARSIVNGKIQSYLLWAMAGLLIFILWIIY